MRSAREKSGLFLAEGVNVVREAINSENIEIEELVFSESFYDKGDYKRLLDDVAHARISVVENRLFKDLSGTETPKGVLAIAKCADYDLDQILNCKDALIVVAYQINDPGNLGTIFRTGLAFGATAILTTTGSVDCYNAKVVRAAAGGLFNIPHKQNLDLSNLLEQARKKSIQPISLIAGAKSMIADLDFKRSSMLILGNEAHGLPGNLSSGSHLSASIRISELTESLNVAVACAVTLYEASKQRA